MAHHPTMQDEQVSHQLRVSNLGFHLLVATSESDVVAVCLHPVDIKEAEESHEILQAQGVPYAAPDDVVSFDRVDVVGYRRQAYRAAREKVGDHHGKIAAELGVSRRTIQNWRRKGLV